MTVTKDGATIYQGTVRPSSSGEAETGAESSDAVFDVPPGRMRVQMRIADATNRPLDLDVRDVTVGNLAGQVALGTAQMFRSRNALEFREIENNAAAVPVAAREFSRIERLLLRVPAYAAGGNPTVTARLMGRTSATIRDLPVRPAPAPDTFQLDLPLAGLANGDYTIELTVAAGDVQARQAVPFRLVP
jgi:hypothetical protein